MEIRSTPFFAKELQKTFRTTGVIRGFVEQCTFGASVRTGRCASHPEANDDFHFVQSDPALAVVSYFDGILPPDGDISMSNVVVVFARRF